MKKNVLRLMAMALVLSVTIIGCSDNNDEDMKPKLLDKKDLRKASEVEEIIIDSTGLTGVISQEEIDFICRELTT
jgi:hypothetical protein